MLRKIVRGMLITIITLSILCLMGCEKTYEYAFLPENCERIFGCSPTELLNEEHDFLAETGDFRKRSYINWRGELVLVLTESQKEAMRNSEWLTSFADVIDESDIEMEISDDFSSITVYWSPKIMGIESEESDEWNKILGIVLARIVLIRKLDGVPFEDISVFYSEINPETGEVVYTETWKPQYIGS